MIISNFKPLKYIIVILIFLSPTNRSSAQISIDPSLPEKYIAERNKFPEVLLEFFNKSEKGDQTSQIAIFSLFEIDTLNLNELVFNDLSNIEILGIYEESEEEKSFREFEQSNRDYMLVNAIKSIDTLQISLGQIFGNEFIDHFIIGNSVTSSFREYYKEDNILKLRNEDTLTNSLDIPVIVGKFVLSTNDFSIKDMIYGYCEMETAPYYRSEDMVNETFLKLKRKFKYYFKFNISQ